jgi:sulfite dehydrogenase (cytochrome) subunit B
VSGAQSLRIGWLAAAAVLTAVLPVAGAGADESRLRLAAGPGADLTRARCAICHSLDYIQMNAPFLARSAWEAEVRKMIKVMGAPVAEAEVAPIVDYLVGRYGSE